MDAEWACNELDVEHFNGSSCCTWCPADREAFNVRGFSDNAKWRWFLASPAFTRPISNHPAWSSGLGASRFSYMGDWMHFGDGGDVVASARVCV